MFLELCTGQSVLKLTEMLKIPQYPTNQACCSGLTTYDDSDDSGSEYSYESDGGSTAPTKVNFEHMKMYSNIRNLNVFFLHDYSRKSPKEGKLKPKIRMKLASPKKSKLN